MKCPRGHTGLENRRRIVAGVRLLRLPPSTFLERTCDLNESTQSRLTPSPSWTTTSACPPGANSPRPSLPSSGARPWCARCLRPWKPRWSPRIRSTESAVRTSIPSRESPCSSPRRRELRGPRLRKRTRGPRRFRPWDRPPTHSSVNWIDHRATNPDQCRFDSCRVHSRASTSAQILDIAGCIRHRAGGLVRGRVCNGCVLATDLPPHTRSSVNWIDHRLPKADQYRFESCRAHWVDAEVNEARRCERRTSGFESRRPTHLGASVRSGTGVRLSPGRTRVQIPYAPPLFVGRTLDWESTGFLIRPLQGSNPWRPTT